MKTKLFIIALVFTSSIAQAQALSETSSIYSTAPASTLIEAVQTIAQKTPLWIQTHNKPDINQYFNDLKSRYIEYANTWSFWQAYILFHAGFAHDACNVILTLEQKNIYSTGIYDYLTSEILLKDPLCPSDAILPKNPQQLESTLDKVTLKNIFLKLIATKNYSLLNIRLNQLSKDIKNDDSLSDLFTFIRAVQDYNGGNTKKAITSINSLLTESAGNAYETEIFAYIESLGIKAGSFLTDKDWLKRANTLLSKGYPVVAREIYKTLSQQNHWDLTAEIASTYFKEKNYIEAVPLYEQLDRQHKQGYQDESVPTQLVLSYARSNKFKEAIDYYHSKSKSLIKLKNISYRLAYLFFDSANYAEAIKFINSAKIEKNNQVDVFWIKFWSTYFLGQYSKAFVLLSDTTFSNQSNERKVLYWKARTLQKAGNIKAARELYSQILNQPKYDYYSFVAKQRMNGPSLDNHSIIDLSQYANPAQESYKELKSLPITKEAISEYLQSRLFGVIQNSESQSILLNKTDEMYLKGAFNQLTANGSILLKTQPPGFNHQAYYWAHPLAYKEWVYFYSGLFGIDPFLSLALMKQESGFRPTIQSPALALGLMQIIPQTARDLAHDLKIQRFHQSDLIVPMTNIKLGTYYLKKLSEEFNNELPFIIASYNAGPLAVKRWRQSRPNLETDEFIDLIPYDETQNYVKKVLTNYWTYYLLYIKQPT